MKILVHLHLYYHNQIDYFIEKLSNISGCDWELYVTVCERNKKTEEKILKLKPDAKIITVSNVGYDIWPFLQVLRLVDLNNFDYVLKLHSKRYIDYVWWPRDYKYKTAKKGFYWRNVLVDALIGNKKIFKANLKTLEEANVGFIADRSYMISLKQNSSSKDLENFENLIKDLNITKKYTHFLAGTMFIIKSMALKRLVDLKVDESDFDSVSEQGITSSYAHAIERIFATLVNDCDYKISLKKNKRLMFYCLLFKIYSKIFSFYKDELGRYIINILGLKISLKKK